MVGPSITQRPSLSTCHLELILWVAILLNLDNMNLITGQIIFTAFSYLAGETWPSHDLCCPLHLCPVLITPHVPNLNLILKPHGYWRLFHDRAYCQNPAAGRSIAHEEWNGRLHYTTPVGQIVSVASRVCFKQWLRLLHSVVSVRWLWRQHGGRLRVSRRALPVWVTVDFLWRMPPTSVPTSYSCCNNISVCHSVINTCHDLFM